MRNAQFYVSGKRSMGCGVFEASQEAKCAKATSQPTAGDWCFNLSAWLQPWICQVNSLSIVRRCTRFNVPVHICHDNVKPPAPGRYNTKLGVNTLNMHVTCLLVCSILDWPGHVVRYFWSIQNIHVSKATSEPTADEHWGAILEHSKRRNV